MIKFGFFGSSNLSVTVLEQLRKFDLLPQFVVTTADKPQGRKMIMTPNVVKQWAIKNNIKCYDESPKKIIDALKNESSDVFIVASYGRILPKEVIYMPPFKTLNIHPSLLPKYRGPSPLPTAILDDCKHTGVTIMRLDEEMDHGPIVAQNEVTIDNWPTYEKFEEFMAIQGATLLAEILPRWLGNEVKETEQDHSKATYTEKITKEDAEIDLAADQYANFRKIQAYHEWPQAYFFIVHNGKKLRIKITDAAFEDGKLQIKKVIPEGSREMTFSDFRQGYKVA